MSGWYKRNLQPIHRKPVSKSLQVHDRKQKFIGGAAMARAKARGKRIMRPDEQQKQQSAIPARWSAWERFFAALLRSSPKDDYPNALPIICKRLGLTVPLTKIPSVCSNYRTHMEFRAALVMEEARFAICQGLRSKKKLLVDLTHVEERERRPIVWHFSRRQKFAPFELQFLKHGTVVLLHRGDLRTWGVVQPSSRDSLLNQQMFSVMTFDSMIGTPKPSEGWQLIPVAWLLTEQRKFEACTTLLKSRLPFANALVGGKTSTHIRFDTVDDSTPEPTTSTTPYGRGPESWKSVHKDFSLKTLNQTQDKAASTFLTSEQNTITLVQGVSTLHFQATLYLQTLTHPYL